MRHKATAVKTSVGDLSESSKASELAQRLDLLRNVTTRLDRQAVMRVADHWCSKGFSSAGFASARIGKCAETVPAWSIYLVCGRKEE
jgi:hypothetical protein